jgi:chromosome condensin MukBEF complex kleisin-like MukF subunit
VAEAENQRLELHRDHRLVLDDEDVGGDLGRQLAPAFLDELPDIGDADAENVGGLLLRETFEGG